MPLGLTIFLASFAASLIAFAGGVFAIFGFDRIKKFTHFVLSFAVGALLGVAILELIPEAVELADIEAVVPWVLAGVLLFFVLEKLLFWYHCHGGECPIHTYTYLILWGDFLHNFIDGVIIALAFLVDVRLGVATTAAVILHEIPQEVGDFGVLVHGGFSNAKALFYNFLSATSVVFGALITYLFGEIFSPFLPFGLALAAGFFIYLAAADLMPELHEATGFGHAAFQILLVILGVFMVIAPEFLLG